MFARTNYQKIHTHTRNGIQTPFECTILFAQSLGNCSVGGSHVMRQFHVYCRLLYGASAMVLIKMQLWTGVWKLNAN